MCCTVAKGDSWQTERFSTRLLILSAEMLHCFQNVSHWLVARFTWIRATLRLAWQVTPRGSALTVTLLACSLKHVGSSFLLSLPFERMKGNNYSAKWWSFTLMRSFKESVLYVVSSIYVRCFSQCLRVRVRNLQPPQYVAKLIGSQSGTNRGSRVAAVGAKP